jgi:hypothetical protein
MLKRFPMTSLPSDDVIKLVYFQQKKTSILKSDLSPLTLRKRFNGMIVENWAKRWQAVRHKTVRSFRC